MRNSLLLSILLITGCNTAKIALNPELDYSVQDKYIQNLQPIFTSLSEEEVSQRWGQEYQIGFAFAKKLDLYQAITAFKRADILIPENNFQRKAEIQYHIINCYYLGKKYFDVIDTFEDSILAGTNRTLSSTSQFLVHSSISL